MEQREDGMAGTWHRLACVVVMQFSTNGMSGKKRPPFSKAFNVRHALNATESDGAEAVLAHPLKVHKLALEAIAQVAPAGPSDAVYKAALEILLPMASDGTALAQKNACLAACGPADFRSIPWGEADSTLPELMAAEPLPVHKAALNALEVFISIETVAAAALNVLGVIAQRRTAEWRVRRPRTRS